MRYAFAFALTTALVLAACGTDDQTIVMVTKDIKVPAGTEWMYCYYVHTNNTEAVAVNKWTSFLSEGSHHMILYANPSGYQKADDEYDTPCPIVGRTQPIWTYTSQIEGHDEWALPTDDGAGKPLGQLIEPNTAMFIQMHLINQTDADFDAHVEITGEVMPTGTEYTPTAGYMAYNNSIMIPPHAMNHVESATCDLPPDVKFWSLQPHSHKQSIHTKLVDGPDMNGPVVLEDSDWAHPKTSFWKTLPFFQFTSSKVSWECTYNNDGDNANNTIYAGQSAVTDEMCVAGGFYFPATKPLACIWDTSIPEGCVCSTTGA